MENRMYELNIYQKIHNIFSEEKIIGRCRSCWNPAYTTHDPDSDEWLKHWGYCLDCYKTINPDRPRVVI